MEEQALENHVLKHYIKGLYRLLCTHSSENPDFCKIPTVAYTGKTAFYVKGSTIHGAFNMPANQKLQYILLGPHGQYMNCTIWSSRMATDSLILMIGNKIFNLRNAHYKRSNVIKGHLEVSVSQQFMFYCNKNMYKMGIYFNHYDVSVGRRQKIVIDGVHL